MVIHIVWRMAYPNIETHALGDIQRLAKVELVEGHDYRIQTLYPVQTTIIRRRPLLIREIGIRHRGLVNKAEQLRCHRVLGVAVVGRVHQPVL